MLKIINVNKEARIAMMSTDHLSNGASPKEVKNRGAIKNRCPFFLIFAIAIMLSGASCKKNDTIDDANNTENTSEKVNITSVNFKEDYNAWFELQGKYIESIKLQIREVKINDYYYGSEKLMVALVENVTDKERAGFLLRAMNLYPLHLLTK